MNISSITWRGKSVDDIEVLRELPPELVRILAETNGFILHDGALHFRGASLTPEWHSLRAALHGESAFHTLYDRIRTTDIPFAQDQVGDQFLLRDGAVLRLSAEVGEVEPLADSLEDFIRRLKDIEGFLNVGLRHTMQPGQLLLAHPPFCLQGSGAGAALRPVPASEVILFHADIARQIRDVPDGGQVVLKFIE